MVRFAWLLPLITLAACDPGSLYDGQVIGADGSVLLCQSQEADNGDGHHHSGEDCLSAGCHRDGGGPAYTIGGTLYDVSRGGAAIGGATITVIDGDGIKFNMVTATNGNFFYTQPVTFPLLVQSSLCPNVNKMVSLSNTGGCNQSGCHGATDIRVALDGR